MAVSRILKYKKFTIDNVTWTPLDIPAGFNCHYAFVFNTDSANILLRSDAGDSNTEITLPSTIQNTVQSTYDLPKDGYGWRFFAGDTVLSAQSTNPTATIVLMMQRN